MNSKNDMPFNLNYTSLIVKLKIIFTIVTSI